MASDRLKTVPSVQIDNDKVIITEWRFASGAETTWQTHQHNHVVVPKTTGRLKIESGSGVTTSNLTAGVPYYRDKGVHHNVINSNEFEFTFIEIELKQIV